jgi:Right handed beta helix region
MPSSRRRTHSKRGFFAIAAVLVVALVGTSASFALASGPIYAFLSKAGKPVKTGTEAKAHQGAVSKASRVILRLRHRTSDKIAPDTSIISGPTATTTSTSTSFGIVASEPNSTLACKLDRGRWRSCSSPKAYSTFAIGSHTFSARATDAAGNVDASPATLTWAIEAVTSPPFPAPAPAPEPEPEPIDTSAPDTAIASGPGVSTTATDASFAISATEPGSTFACKLDDGSWEACGSPKSYSGLTVGSHVLSTRATDVAGNVDTTPATWVWTVEAIAPPPPPADTTAPETSITGGPAATSTSTSASFDFSANEAGSSFACKLDGASWSGCSSPRAYSSLAVGTHTFAVRATDAAGNVDGTPASRSWTVEAVAPPPPPADTTPPETSIVSGPAATTTSTAASFSLSASESGSTLACKLDSGSWGACTSPKAYSGLAVGSHTFSARATDTAGNTDATPTTQTWTVEAVAPPPPPPSDECTSTVSTVSAAQSGVSSASPGSVVCLASGSYGKVALSATKAVPGVTLRAATPGGATIAGASLQGSNLTLARFLSTGSIQIQPGANGMTVEHNKVTGGGQGIDACPSSSTTCNDMAIVGNELIGPFGEDAIHLNRYHDGDGNGVGVLIEGNEITNVRENGNHSDCLQTVWVGDHIVFRKNYLHDNRCQGFFVKDQASLGGVSGPIAGITVEDNLFLRNHEPCGPPLTSCGQPMYFQVFGPYSGFTMRRNTIWGDGGDSIAAFRESAGSNTVISNNVIYRLWNDFNMSSTTVTNNTICSRESGSGGSWPSSRPGETVACSLGFANTAADDYRLSGSDRGVDWAPAEQHFGP